MHSQARFINRDTVPLRFVHLHGMLLSVVSTLGTLFTPGLFSQDALMLILFIDMDHRNSFVSREYRAPQSTHHCDHFSCRRPVRGGSIASLSCHRAESGPSRSWRAMSSNIASRTRRTGEFPSI